MKLLILGGGVFLGAATLRAALQRGHAVTVFNRGRACTAWPAGVEVLTGDRSADLSRLQGRHWDAVIDTCGYVPADLRASTEALAWCEAYLFVSSISAYASTRHAPLRETDALANAAGIAADDRDMAHYGAQKAACEAEVLQRFGRHALIVRPGLIVGPGDRTGRFSHWPWRMAEGGTMLVPAVPDDTPLQFIDVRDLAAWLVHLLEQGLRGTWNATGPADGSTGTWAALLHACRTEVAARGGEPARSVRVDEGFLEAQGVQPWSELPLWLPSADEEYTGFHRVDLSRARAAGLHTRPLRDTVAAVLDEGLPPPEDARRSGRLTREREAQLLSLAAAPR